MQRGLGNKTITKVLAGLSLLLLGACGGMEPSPGEATQTSRYLFGLSSAEIADLGARYGSAADITKLKWQLQAPFTCERFGQLCEAVGSLEAPSIVELQWSLMRQGVAKVALLERVEGAMDTARRRHLATLGDDQHPVAEPASPASNGGIGKKEQATSGRLHCPIGSTREVSNSTDKIITTALVSDIGTIAVSTVTTTHYRKILWFWIKRAAASLCIRDPSMIRWISATGDYTTFDGTEYCRVNVSEISKSMGMYGASGDRLRGTGCGDFNGHTLYKCACDMAAMD